MLQRRNEPARKSIAAALMLDLYASAAQKRAMFENGRADRGFANENSAGPANAERMLREFASMEKRDG